MANAKIKKINLGGTTYDIHDEATAEKVDQRVATINGYAYDAVNDGTVKFANLKISDTEINSAVEALDTGN